MDEGLETYGKVASLEEEEDIFYSVQGWSFFPRLGFSAVKHSVERSKYIEPSFDSVRLSSRAGKAGCVGVPFEVGSCGGRESDARGSFPCN